MRDDRDDIRELARGRWQSILPAIGIPETALSNRHGPCPACGGKDRYRFDDKNGEGTWYCNHCGAGDGFSMMMKVTGGDFPSAVARVREVLGSAPPPPRTRPGREPDEAKARDEKNRIWREARPICAEDVAGRYLGERQIRPDPYPAALRLHPRLRYQDHIGTTFGPASFHPAMVAMVTGADGKPLTLHRTFLSTVAGKANVPSPRKLMFGKAKALQGAAIRLTPVSEHLAVAEGIETALSVTALYGLPCWALISTALMVSWEPPEGVEEVTIYADNDEHFAGAKAGGALAHKLAGAKSLRRVSFTFPERTGWDWNDVLKFERPELSSRREEALPIAMKEGQP